MVFVYLRLFIFLEDVDVSEYLLNCTKVIWVVVAKMSPGIFDVIINRSVFISMMFVYLGLLIFLEDFHVSEYLLNCTKVIWVVVAKRSTGLCVVFICR